MGAGFTGPLKSMPKPFENCVAAGGRVRTRVLPGGRYVHICFRGKHSYAGHVKHHHQEQPRVGKHRK